MAVESFSVSQEKVKLRYRERYVTEGSNEKALAIPRGCYRGFIPRESLVPDTRIWLGVDPLGLGVDVDSFAIYAEYNDGAPNYDGYALSIREIADVELDLNGTALLPIPGGVNYLYVYITAEYQGGSATVVTYSVSDEDPYDVGSSNYDVNVILIGRIPVTPGATTISFDITNPVVQADVFAVRKFPMPTPDQSGLGLGWGDSRWGYLDTVSAWRIPNNNQKEAMNNASSPSASNPFATENESSNIYVGEAKRIVAVLNPATNYLNLTGSFYVGKGAVESADEFFAIMEPERPDWAYEDETNAPMVLIRICKDGTTTEVVPSADADAEGFITNPRIHYSNPSSVVQTVEILAFEKKQIKTLSTAPAYAIPQAGMLKKPHADQILKRVYSNPPATVRIDEGNVGAAVRRLEEASRGTNSLAMTDQRVQERAFLNTDGTCDAQMFGVNGPNWHDLNPWTVWAVEPWRDPNDGTLYLIMILTDGAVMRLGRYNPATSSLITASVDASFGGGTHRIDAIAVDDEHIYVRAYNAASRDDKLRAFSPYDLGNEWASYVLITNTGFVGAQPKLGEPVVLCVSDDKIAVNLWNLNLVGGTSATTGIKVYYKVDGSYVNGGCGGVHAITGWPFGQTGIFARGPMCTDGNNIYFSLWLSDAGYTGPSVQLEVADPTSSDVANWIGTQFPLGYTRGMVSDGGYVWTFQAGGVSVAIPYWANLSLDQIVDPIMVNFGDEFFGGVCFDGKFIWAVYLNTATGRYDLHKIDPRALKNRWTIGDPGGYYSVLVKSFISPVDALMAETISPVGWTTRPCFDGENIWYAPEALWTEPMAGILLRLPLAKYL